MENIYFFQWISDLGGADTRLKELIQLFSKSKKYKLFCIPNDDFRLSESHNVSFLKEHSVNILSWDSLPQKTSGFAISFSNFRIFSESWRINKIKSLGLNFIWSNDMMWRTNEELYAFNQNLIDAAIYTSEKHYQDISNSYTQSIKNFIVPNYFELKNYPYIDRSNRTITTIGKHSRSDILKYSDNFPLFYEDLNIENPRYRVMGFNDNIYNKFKWFSFDNKWDLLVENQENTLDFLQSLDIYLYNSHYRFIETQCRATIEAMLTGLPVVAPFKFNFFNQIWNGKSGFLWDTYEECQKAVKILEKNPKLRKEMGSLARIISSHLWCDSEQHLNLWENLFSNI